MNMEILCPSRKKIRPGDIFVYKMKVMSEKYWFGRVIRTDATIGFPGVILIYLYNLHSKDKYDIPELGPDKLLSPPTSINRLAWSKGYFETIENAPLTEMDLLPAHHFKSDFFNKYYDADGNEVKNPIDIVGEYGLNSYSSLDDEISLAMGIPLSKDDEE